MWSACINNIYLIYIYSGDFDSNINTNRGSYTLIQETVTLIYVDNAHIWEHTEICLI